MTKDATESFERRVAAYLEMSPAIMVVVLNFHFKQRRVFNQSRLFDLRCFTEALRRSPIDTSKILSKKKVFVLTFYSLREKCLLGEERQQQQYLE